MKREYPLALVMLQPEAMPGSYLNQGKTSVSYTHLDSPSALFDFGEKYYRGGIPGKLSAPVRGRITEQV